MKIKLLIIFFFIGIVKISAQDCSDINTETDKFTGQVKSNSPLNFYIIYFKTITIDTLKENDTSYYVRLQTLGATLNLATKGVIILLENGNKLEFPNAEVNYDKSEFIGTSIFYNYYSFIKLSKIDIEKLSNSGISEYRLYIYDSKVRKKHLSKFKEFLNCLLNN